MHSIEHSSLCKMFLTQQQGRKGTSLCEVHSRAQGWVGRSLKIKQLHADETTKRGKSVLGVVTTILQENNKLKTICLAGDIIPENGTAEVQTKEIILSFAEGGRFLDDWREQTKMMYANDPDLNEMINQIPGRERLSVSRLLKVFYTSDTCGARGRVKDCLPKR